MSPDRFASLYSHGFVRVAAGVPHMRTAEPAFNAERMLALARQASDEQAKKMIKLYPKPKVKHPPPSGFAIVKP